jgi:chromosome segregation ATPase
VSAYQVQKLFTYQVESTYREDFIEACYLYCDAKRDTDAVRDEESEVTSAPQTMPQELEDCKIALQKAENRVNELQKEIEQLEQIIQLESEAEEQKKTFLDLEAQLNEKNNFIESLQRKLESQNRQQQAWHELQNQLSQQNLALQHYIQALRKYQQTAQKTPDGFDNELQKQLAVLQNQLSLQNLALQHYIQSLQEHQETAQQTHDGLKQEIELLQKENEQLILSKEVILKQKNKLFIITTLLLMVLVLMILATVFVCK